MKPKKDYFMNPKKATNKSQKVTQLAEQLRTSAPETTGEHLTDDLYIGYITGTLPAGETQTVPAHLETCQACAARMELLVNQARMWEGLEGKIRLEERRKELLRLTLENVAHKRTLFASLAEELSKIVFRPQLALAPGYARAATPVQDAQGETENGTLQWYYGPDEKGNLVIRVSSFNLDLQGVRVILRAGTWERLVELDLVELDQVGMETIISQTELSQIDLSQGIRFEIAV